jgi:hypothetical protein
MTSAVVDNKLEIDPVSRGVRDRVSSISIRIVTSLLFAGPLFARFKLLTRLPLDRHAFRQTQTLFSAAFFARDGISLLHPKTPVYGSPWEVPFEFPLFQAIVAIVHNVTGISISTSGRLVSLISFLGCGIALYWILRRLGIDRRICVGILVVFNATPYLVVWSVAALIEWFSVLLALLGCIVSMKVLDLLRGPDPQVGEVAAHSLIDKYRNVICSLTTTVLVAIWAVAGAVKITTVISTLPILVILMWPNLRSKRAYAVTLLSVVSALGGGLLWTAHADAIKGRSYSTAWMISKALVQWNFGTLGQRLSSREWTKLVTTEAIALGPVWVLCTISLAIWIVNKRSSGEIPTRRNSNHMPIAIVGLGVFCGPLVFFNLFVVHDYYSCEIIPMAVVFSGLLLNRLQWNGAKATLLVVLLSNVLTMGYAQVSFGATAFYNGGHYVNAAALVRENCPAGNVIVIADDWDPSILYLSDRMGYMAEGSVRSSRFAADPNGLDSSYTCAVGPAVKGLPQYLRQHFSGKVVLSRGYALYLRKT